MKVLYAEFRARAGCESRVAELMSELTARVRDEPGNLRFEPYTRVENPRDYVVFEIYTDEDAFQDHLRSPHSQLFNEALQDVIEGAGSTLTWLCPANVRQGSRG